MTTIYKHKTYAKNESEITSGIEARRMPNGDVELRITAEGEWDDEPISLHKTLSAEESEKLGRTLLCIQKRCVRQIDRTSIEVRR